MTAFLPALSFFAAVLLAPAFALNCEQCLSIGQQTTCSSKVTACPVASTKCIQGLENNTYDGDVILTAFKSCFTPPAPELSCSTAGHSLQTSRLTIRFSAVCGASNLKFIAPPVNNNLNGYKCPDCLIEDSMDECVTSKFIKCTGSQTSCFSIRASGYRPGREEKLYMFKGCTTPNFCSIFKHLPGSRAKRLVSVCTPATRV